MKRERALSFRDAFCKPHIPHRERGQILPIMIVMLATFFGMCGFVVDAGRVYISYQQLQASTDAAALAGALLLPTKSTAVANATLYSSAPGGKNAFSNLSSTTPVAVYPTVKCLTLVKGEGAACDGTTTFNAIQVAQTATIPMTFAKFFGMQAVAISATATAAEKGGAYNPYNIAVIIDSTGSMGTAGSDSCTDPVTSSTYTTRIQCALVGLKIVLLNTAPCSSSLSTCVPGTTNSVDMISVFTFPNVTVGNAVYDYSSGCTGASAAGTYSFPNYNLTDNSYSPSGSSTATYQITPFLNDYRTSDAATTLNATSNLTTLLGPPGGTSCAGMKAPGSLNTFYAGAIAAAQAALLQEQALTGRENTKNAIILLSDGDANATTAHLASTDTTGTHTISSTSTSYPSKIDQCQQGIYAAQAATTAGTTVYSVSYGASASTGCQFDTSGTLKGLTACTAMADMASSPSTFFSDWTAAGADANCKSAQQPTTGLANIFGLITDDFSRARLIPNTTQ
jgi:hypothetical protein